MKTLYVKNELTFAVVWIMVYCVLQSLASCFMHIREKWEKHTEVK